MYVKPAVLAVVFALTAVAAAIAQVLPRDDSFEPVALLLDVVPFALVIAATVFAAVQLKRSSVPLSHLLLSAYTYFAGALVATLGVAHLVGVVALAIRRGYRNEFVYDFHFYSVMLLGVLLTTLGLMANFEADRVARAVRTGWRASLLVWTAILAINLPLVPLQGFAVLFSVIGGVEVLLLVGTRYKFADGTSTV